ncbi:36470_t:CDS:1 [Gigaspora margarita]|uniref:36470_t:CDS:1 n=2 Tax=Gigaspora margarita TaxID=4874 RepID=A0ABN7UVU3_GIGMA|nr:MATA-HMG [Gigaspora margarita]CAG8672276.1 36470_t:CDS:1 [Gigaspora margarita]
MNITDITQLQIIVPSQPLFPPPITQDQLETYSTRINGKLQRIPTAFLIYKIAYRQQLIADNNLPPAHVFSHMASLSYNREPRHVKAAYVNLSILLRSER